MPSKSCGLRSPAGVRRLTAIPTLGPKRAMVLHETLGISSVDELAEDVPAALSGVTGGVRCEYTGSLRGCRETVGDVINTWPLDRLLAFLAGSR